MIYFLLSALVVIAVIWALSSYIAKLRRRETRYIVQYRKPHSAKVYTSVLPTKGLYDTWLKKFDKEVKQGIYHPVHDLVTERYDPKREGYDIDER